MFAWLCPYSIQSPLMIKLRLVNGPYDTPYSERLSKLDRCYCWIAGVVRRSVGSVLTAAVVIYCLGGSAVAEEAWIGTVKTVQGTAFIIRNAVRIEAIVGNDIHRFDQLQTGPDGALGVTLRDGTLLALGHEAMFTVDEFAFLPENKKLSFIGRLLQGSLVYASGAIARLAPQRVRIESPLGTVGVRGTRFALRVPRNASGSKSSWKSEPTR
jgi:hypothetical protein